MTEAKENTSKILIVDDDKSVRNVIQEYLANYGFQTYSVPTNGAALDCLLSENIDLVISDINRPGVNGLEFMQRVKTFCNVDFIILSGTILNKFRTPEECFDAGASAVFAKPAKLIDILDIVKSLLKKNSVYEI